VVYGSGARDRPNSKMPPWAGVIKEEEYGPLAEYVASLARK
jgi:hypothetical protein